MAKKIDIAGTLNAATTDGVLGFSEQIKDESKGKMQSSLNKEFGEGIDRIERKSDIAYNAVKTLEGLSNANEAMQTLAGQVVQIEENKQNIASNKADADAKLSELGSEVLPTTELNFSISDFVDGYYVVCNKVGEKPHEPVAVSNYAYMYQDTKEGDVWEMKLLGGGSGRAWALLNEEGLVVEFSENTGFGDYSVTIPKGVVRILFNTQYSTGDKDLQYVRRKWAESNEDKSTKLKILCFGNSFTEDSMGYVPYIIKKIAPNLKLTLGLARIGGCPLAQHLASFTDTTQSIDGTDYQRAKYSYTKSTEGSPWVFVAAQYPDDIIKDDDWDIITFQQNGGASYKDYDTYYAPFIYKLHKSLFDKVSKPTKIGWLLTHGAYTENPSEAETRWEGTANNAKEIMKMTGTSILFPYGTAVQNLRTTSLKTIGDNGGGLFMGDIAHLQEGIGCLVAAYTNVLTILKIVGMEHIGIIGDSTRITSELLTEINMPGQNLGTSGVVGISDNNCYLAQVAATCAMKNPYEVTDLKAVEGGL